MESRRLDQVVYHAPTASGQLPLVEPMPYPADLEELFLRFSQLPHCAFLDSALVHERLGRFSFLTADPFAFFSRPLEESNLLHKLERLLSQWQSSTAADLPPFQGGAVVLLSYDLGRQLERLPGPRYHDFALPALAVGFYDVVLAVDHVGRQAWLISQGFPEQTFSRRLDRAATRLDQFRAVMQAQPVPSASTVARGPASTIAIDRLAPQFPVPSKPGLWSNFRRDDYMRAVEQVIEYIYAGDVFQVNLSQRLLCTSNCPPWQLYLRLRRCNPATFAAYFDCGTLQIVSASPERFLKVENRRVETRPIKGTCRRTGDPQLDQQACRQLLSSRKDRAENVMIVDLLRNDLSRVCRPDSVRVTQLCGLEQYQFVYHLVSAVVGHLRDECSLVDLIRATFPGGSITGAPKIRAMEIIAELEPTARGPYCGSLGYIGFDGTMDINILIRTIVAAQGWWQACVGGGVIASSDPAREYEETWEKAEGLLRAMLP